MGTSNYNGLKAYDKLTGKEYFHAWKMTLDLMLEDQDVMDYVQGKIQEPPSTATAATKTKYKEHKVWLSTRDKPSPLLRGKPFVRFFLLKLLI